MQIPFRLLGAFLSSYVALGLLCAPGATLAEPPTELQSGEIKQEQDADQVDSTAETQERTIAYFKELETTISQAAHGIAPAPLPALPDNSLLYLNAVYLYCTINSGTCPAVLDALLEVDTINARLNSKAECPNLKQFWKLWIKGQMEERQNFQVKTAYLETTTTFKKTQRTRYIKCEDTVAASITGDESPSAYFTHRYQQNSAPRKTATSLIQLLTEVKSEVPDIFTAVK